MSIKEFWEVSKKMSQEPGDTIGVFIGLDSSSYEYLASIITPFQQEYIPRIGGFMLIDNLDEYIVARIMDYVPTGEFMSSMGMKWLSEVALTPDLIGQDIKTKKVRYQIKIKLLGRLDKDLKEFTPGISQIPHITSKVIEPTPKTIEIICNKALADMEKGVKIGKYWLNQDIDVRFNLEQLIGKRTFIFARAGYGKSNLMKILASNWKNGYGGLIIFDPEGEYSITDKNGSPGIMDKIPAILITNRKKETQELGFNVYTELKFDLRDFLPSFIVPILVAETKHENIFFHKLMGLSQTKWAKLVDYLVENEWNPSTEEILQIMNVSIDDKTSAPAITNNIVLPIKRLHDPKSALLKILEDSMRKGYPVIIDISLLDSRSALQLSSIIVGHFFNKNQRKFTGGTEEINKIVFVMEEAQSVIGGTTNVSKFIELAKEGRKYQLGGIFITQQPGSISKEILSQGDNFFVFHLLSKGDLKALQDANAHYSNDILTQVLNEPIRGKAYMWTSNQPFVLPIKILNFEEETEANKSKEVQSRTDLLNPILKDISKFDSIEIKLFQKVKSILTNKNIDINNEITNSPEEREITREIFRKLSQEEFEFINKDDGIQKNSKTDEEFALTFLYFRKLMYKMRLYFSDMKEKPDDCMRG